ncbi:MAG: phosphoribosylanthranilate isomerase [Ginsengibacter sp.]
MKIKVCGVTQPEQLLQLCDMDIEYVGFIFYPGSPRYVMNQLQVKDVARLKSSTQKVGVFVNASEDEIMAQVELYKLDAVQLHGNESPSFCNNISDHIKVIKAFRINDEVTNIDWMVKPYEEACDFYLFDQGAMGIYGGTGKKFDWSLIQNANLGKQFFLSGGIGPDDAMALKEFSHPYFYGIDINSRFEIEPGVKDMPAVIEFVKTVRS